MFQSGCRRTAAFATVALFGLLACATSKGGGDDDPAIYASPDGDDNAAGDAPETAVATVPVAIMRAAACEPEPCEVRLAAGDYTGQIVLADGVSLVGGFAPGFEERDPLVHVTAITSTEVRTVIAEGLRAPVRLDGLTIRGADFTDGPAGEPNYAMWVRDCADAIAIVDTIIVGGTGGRGLPGDHGEEIACTATGGQGGEAFDCGASIGADGAAAGDPAAGGLGGDPGSSNCPNACPLVGGDGISDGDPGADGLAGADGLPGAPPTDALGQFFGGYWVGAVGEPGTRGAHGTGGGGGGSGGTKRFRACFGCGTLLGGRGGDGAAGGCGGGPGQPGHPGGGAFGLVIIDSVVAFDRAVVEGGTGGQGGLGGNGRAGQPPADPIANAGPAPTQQCGAINYRAGAGGPGGLGGPGGSGGSGPGGPGGPSVAIVLLGDAALDELGILTTRPGTPGGGGRGGHTGVPALPGPDGDGLAILTFDAP